MDSSDVPPPRGAHKVVLAMILAVAAGLRLWHLGQGLPDFLEEAIPLRMAIGIGSPAGGYDFNPHTFNYPTLPMYLHFAVQQLVFAIGSAAGAWHGYADYLLAFSLDPTAMVIAARLVGVVSDLVVIATVLSLGERVARGAGIVAAVTLAIAPTPISIARTIYTDSLLAMFAVLAIDRLLRWEQTNRRRDAVLTFVLIGLAAGAKYPGAILLAPAFGLMAVRMRGRALLPVLAGGAVAALTFLATTPYILVEPAAFLRDFRFESAHAATGHFGSMQGHSFGYQAQLLVVNLGVAGVVLSVAALIWAWRVPRLRIPVAVLTAAFAGFFVPIAIARINAERYILPVLPVVALLAGIAMTLVFTRARRPVRLGVAGLCALSLALVAAAGFRTAATGGDTTQVRARAWMEQHIGPTELVVQEGYAARLTSALMVRDMMDGPIWQHASESGRERVKKLHTFTTVSVPLWVAGSITVPMRTATGTAHVEIAPHASLVSSVFYEPALYAEADWFVVSSAVADRYRLDPARYPVQSAFYDLLRENATPVVTILSTDKVVGPTITVYRLTDAWREVAGDLASDWWRESVPAKHRETPVAESFYRAYVMPYVTDMTLASATAGHNAQMFALARATLAVAPLDESANAMYSAGAARLGRWSDVIANTDRLAKALSPEPVPSGIALLNARALNRSGRAGAARALLQDLLKRLPESDPVAAAARADLATLAGTRPAPKTREAAPDRDRPVAVAQ